MGAPVSWQQFVKPSLREAGNAPDLASSGEIAGFHHGGEHRHPAQQSSIQRDDLLIELLPGPLLKIAADAAEDMLRFAGEFGLTPVARTRLASGGSSAAIATWVR
jgi:hypothetical protein